MNAYLSQYYKWENEIVSLLRFDIFTIQPMIVKLGTCVFLASNMEKHIVSFIPKNTGSTAGKI